MTLSNGIFNYNFYSFHNVILTNKIAQRNFIWHGFYWIIILCYYYNSPTNFHIKKDDLLIWTQPHFQFKKKHLLRQSIYNINIKLICSWYHHLSLLQTVSLNKQSFFSNWQWDCVLSFKLHFLYHVNLPPKNNRIKFS